MTKWQTRQALYLLGLTGILYLFSCKSQDICQIHKLSQFPLFYISIYISIFQCYHIKKLKMKGTYFHE